MLLKRKFLITIIVISIFALFTIFFVGVRLGAKQENCKQELFSAFKVMKDLEALRASQLENNKITSLIQEKEGDLDYELASVPSCQRNGLHWLNFVLAKSNDAVFLRSIADYRHRYPSKPMSFKSLTNQQREFYLKLYSDMLREQNSLFKEYN